MALTLREVCGLTTEDIAHAFLTAAPTVAQRIVRAKAKIRDARIPYEAPAPQRARRAARLCAHVIYLVFNEGYSAASGDSLMRPDLSAEAIRLGRLLVALLPDPEATGLLALMLLHESRREARATPEGEVVLLEDQDRSLWNGARIARGAALVRRVLAGREVGFYAIQAAIAAEHAEARRAWPRRIGRGSSSSTICSMHADPSPVVALNRAAASPMRDGPAAGLALIDAILERGELGDYHPAHSARAELCRRLGRTAEAAASYDKAISLARQDPARHFLEKRRRALDVSS